MLEAVGGGDTSGGGSGGKGGGGKGARGEDLAKRLSKFTKNLAIFP